MDTDEEGGQLECQNPEPPNIELALATLITYVYILITYVYIPREYTAKELGLEGLSPREQESLKFLLDTIAALDGDGGRDRQRDLEVLDSDQVSAPDGPMEHEPLSTMPQPLATPSRLRKFDTIVRSGISVRELRDHFRRLNQGPGTKETTGKMLPPRTQKLAGTTSQVARIPKLGTGL